MASSCSDFHKWTNHSDADICPFIRSTKDCDIDEGFVNYLQFLFCDFTATTRFIAVITEIIWWLIMFMALAKTADNFFCPNLTVLSKLFRCSDSFAGVTLVAFGNGSPDIFSALSAVLGGDSQDLAFGALLGAGIFVTSVVPAVIAIVHPFKTAERPLLKDLIFYIGAVFWVFYIFYQGSISFFEAIGFLILYVVYVIITIIGRIIYIRSQPARVLEINAEYDGSSHSELPTLNDDVHERTHLLNSPRPDRSTSKGSFLHLIEPNYMAQLTIDGGIPSFQELHATEISLNFRAKLKDFLKNLNPICVEEWPEMNKVEKIFHCIQAIVVLPLTIIVPVVDITKEKENWQKYLTLLQCLITPVICGFLLKLNLFYLGGSTFQVWGVILIISFLLVPLIHFTSRYESPPIYHHLLSIAGFLISVVVIYSIANEIVNILNAIGVFFYLPQVILGLTLLALGNSVGDLFSDYALAKGGRPRMAISACFGGPLFNLLLGISLPFSLRSVKIGFKSVKIPYNPTNYILVGFLQGSLIFTLLFVLFNKFHLNKFYGISLLVIYGTFLISVIVFVVAKKTIL